MVLVIIVFWSNVVELSGALNRTETFHAETEFNPSGPKLICNFDPLAQDCQKIKGDPSPQHFLLRKCRFDRHHAGATPRARNRLGALVGHVTGIFARSFSPNALDTFLFSMLLTLQPP